MRIAGIDYGSKMAGTTVIATFEMPALQWKIVPKKDDADQFIMGWAEQARPSHLFLDAPLSLPGVYRGLDGYNDYFYRKADREAGAMSPMFLGGLTARAMRLKAKLERLDIQVLEAYPAALARLLELDKTKYKKKKAYLPEIYQHLKRHFPASPSGPVPSSWHEIDALLALITGYRYMGNGHLAIGDPEEGRIIV